MGVMNLIVFMLFVPNMFEQYVLAHIYPGKEYLIGVSQDLQNEWSKEISDHYFNILVIPIRRAIVIDAYGPDIGPVILSYLPLVDKYDNSNKNMIKVSHVI